MPTCPPRGRFAFSYHTHGQVAGRWHYKFGHFSNLMQIDPHGYAGYSSLASMSVQEIRDATAYLDDDSIVDILATYRQEYIGQRFTWREQKDPLAQASKRGKRSIFVPLQDPLDEVSNLAFFGPTEMLQALAHCTGPNDRIFVKRHPVDKTSRTTRLLEIFVNDPRFVVVDASIHDLFEACDLVVTINSGVGFEALLAGLPVITCGLSDYNLATITARSVDELIDAIDTGALPDPAWRRRVLYYYFKHHVFDPLQPEDFESRLAALLGLQPLPQSVTRSYLNPGFGDR